MAVGFLAVLVLLGVLIYAWNENVTGKNVALSRVMQEHERSRLVSTMLAAGHRQSLALLQMAGAGTGQEREAHHRSFQDSVETFARAREEILSHSLPEPESRTWKTAGLFHEAIAELQQEAMELIYRDDIATAHHLLLEDLGPVQAEFMGQLSDVLKTQESLVREEIDTVMAQNRSTYLLISWLGAAAILWSALTIVAIQRNSGAERRLLKQGDRIRALYEISAQPGLSVEEQITRTLKMGCRVLGMDIGKVCQIDEGAQTNTFLYTVGMGDAAGRSGTVLPLEKTFCSIPFRSGKAVAISHVKESEFTTYPCYEFSHLEAYIAAPVWVNGLKRGTINFASQRPRASDFDQGDLDVIQLIANAVAVVLERQTAAQLRFEKELVDQANQAKNAFLANMSHELRTPLNAIIGYAELLEEEFAARDEKVIYFKDVARIKLAASHLLGLINNILDLSKIETGSMEVRCEDFPVRRILDEVTAMITPMIDRNNNQYRVNCDEGFIMMYSDPLRLKQALFNLVSNASKYTTDGLVTLSARREGESAIFEVADTGIGMSAEQTAKLFQPFSQSNLPSANPYGGAGLGSAICQRICHLLGGKITVVSRVGQGSLFTVTLPINYNTGAVLSS